MEGFEIMGAENAEAAINFLRDRSYDLLLTDYLMEGVTGIELMQQARKLYPEIKVIIFSGYADHSLADKIIRLGADAFFCKPVGFDDLLKFITRVLTS